MKILLNPIKRWFRRFFYSVDVVDLYDESTVYFDPVRHYYLKPHALFRNVTFNRYCYKTFCNRKVNYGVEFSRSPELCFRCMTLKVVYDESSH